MNTANCLLTVGAISMSSGLVLHIEELKKAGYPLLVTAPADCDGQVTC